MAENYNAASDILGGLLRSAGKIPKDTEKILSAYGGALPNLLAQLVNNISSAPAKEDLNKSLQGTQTMQKNPEFNPYQEIVHKAVKKNLEPQIATAMQVGVPGEYILSQAGILNQGFEKGISSSVHQQKDISSNKNQENPSYSIKKARGPFSQSSATLDERGNIVLQKGGFFDLGGSYADLENIEMLQKLTGQQPIQQKDLLEIGSKRQEAKYKTATDYINSILNPTPMSAELVKQKDFVDTGLNSANELLNVLENEPEALKQLAVPFNPKGQQLKLFADTLKSVMLRKDTGAAFTKEDIKFVENLTASQGNLLEDSKTTKLKLQQIVSRFNRTREAIEPNRKKKTVIQSLQQAGYDDNQIYEFLRSKGNL